MMTKLLKGLIAFMLVAAVFSTAAEARYYGHGGHYHGHGGYYGGGWGYYGGGFATGLLLGGLLAAPRYYYPAPGYYYDGPVSDDAVGYCLRRFKSYDPRSGTYLGYDGYRHPCP